MNALALFLFAAPLVQDPQVLDARIDSVTVYPRSAHVHRSSEAVHADGSYVIEGLTSDLDRSKVRVKCEHGEIVRVDEDGPLVMAALEHRRSRFDPASEPVSIERQRQNRILAKGKNGGPQILAQRKRTFGIEAGKGLAGPTS